MDSIKNIYKIGHGPSSSHTMGPAVAAEIFKNKYPEADTFIVELFGSLALTGKGHLTDKVLKDVLGENTKVLFNYQKVFDYHPNALCLHAFKKQTEIGEWLVFSVGGGFLSELDQDRQMSEDAIYKDKNMDEILSTCKKDNLTLLEYIDKIDPNIDDHLLKCWHQMEETIETGLKKTDKLPGRLNVQRKANSFYNQHLKDGNKTTYLYAAALATAEENGSGGIVVTAPTCGSSGVLPAVLKYSKLFRHKTDQDIVNAMKIAGLIGNICKFNASISGAEVGCQGEIGVACAMASAAYAFLLDATNEQIEYAAEIALEHHLGLTCDPVDGQVQIPCIERNAIAAIKSIDAAKYALLTDGMHYVSLDHAIDTMKQTGLDLSYKYKETSIGGLARKR